MTEQELHDLMIKIEERTRNIWRVTEALEAHIREQNGYIRETLIRSRVNRYLLYVGGVIISTLVGWVTRIQGMW